MRFSRFMYFFFYVVKVQVIYYYYINLFVMNVCLIKHIFICSNTEAYETEREAILLHARSSIFCLDYPRILRCPTLSPFLSASFCPQETFTVGESRVKDIDYIKGVFFIKKKNVLFGFGRQRIFANLSMPSLFYLVKTRKFDLVEPDLNLFSDPFYKTFCIEVLGIRSVNVFFRSFRFADFDHLKKPNLLVRFLRCVVYDFLDDIAFLVRVTLLVLKGARYFFSLTIFEKYDESWAWFFRTKYLVLKKLRVYLLFEQYLHETLVIFLTPRSLVYVWYDILFFLGWVKKQYKKAEYFLSFIWVILLFILYGFVTLMPAMING